MGWVPCRCQFFLFACIYSHVTAETDLAIISAIAQDDAEKSNGIAKPAGSNDEVKAKEEKKAKEVEQMPQSVKDAIKNNMAEYQYLREKAFMVPS